MTNAKIQCDFCGSTNTKMEDQYASSGFFGLGSKKVGSREVIDSDAQSFYRCVSCGRFYCESCYTKMCKKSALGFFVKKRWVECPKCGSEKIIQI